MNHSESIYTSIIKNSLHTLIDNKSMSSSLLHNLNSSAYSNQYSDNDNLTGVFLMYVSDEENLFKIANFIITKYGHLSYHTACGTLTDGRSALALYARVEVHAEDEHQSIDRDGSSYYRWGMKHVPLKFRYESVIVNGGETLCNQSSIS